jgi:hypothetical protein
MTDPTPNARAHEEGCLDPKEAERAEFYGEPHDSSTCACWCHDGPATPTSSTREAVWEAIGRYAEADEHSGRCEELLAVERALDAYAASVADARETSASAWLVERVIDGRPHWLAWRNRDRCEWVIDAWQADRFEWAVAAQQEARRVATSQRVDCFAIEHTFVADARGREVKVALRKLVEWVERETDGRDWPHPVLETARAALRPEAPRIVDEEGPDLRQALIGVLVKHGCSDYTGCAVCPPARQALRGDFRPEARPVGEGRRKPRQRPCPDCGRTDPHIHCPECGATDHAASTCDNLG